MLSSFFLFALTSFLLIIVPGPDTAIVTRNTIVHKTTGGFQTLIGTCLALSIHTTAAVIGLSAIIMQSAVIFTIFKYVGAAYLIYLGVKALFEMKKRGYGSVDEEEALPSQNKSLMLQGFLTNISNPKVAVFFLTLMPQFVQPGANTIVTFSILGAIYLIIQFLWFVAYIYVINYARVWMKKASVKKAMDGLTGAVFIGFGLRLAFEKQP